MKSSCSALPTHRPEKYLVAAERNGWVVGVESMKGYIELAELALAVDVPWEEGREALRWLAQEKGGACGFLAIADGVHSQVSPSFVIAKNSLKNNGKR